MFVPKGRAQMAAEQMMFNAVRKISETQSEVITQKEKSPDQMVQVIIKLDRIKRAQERLINEFERVIADYTFD
jgi:hypothetical protein